MGSMLDFQLQGLWLKSGFCHCVFFFGQETLLQVVPLQPGCKWEMAFTISREHDKILEVVLWHEMSEMTYYHNLLPFGLVAQLVVKKQHW